MQNMSIISRNAFLKCSLTATAALFSPLAVATTGIKDQERPAPMPLEVVKEFVIASHSNLPRVKEMLEADHLLLHTSHDWGGGDFESGIEAAGHVGNKEIANYLISKGARYNIFLACMLGHLDVVKGALDFNGGLLHAKGPHGFTLLHHAMKGGSDEVVAFLKDAGATATRIPFYDRL